MDDAAFRQKYKKYKIRVKLWEKDFRKRNGRVPSKHDIREAPQEIRDSYKMYYKLKTSFLEDTLNDALDDDGFDILEITQASGLGVGDNCDEDEACLSFNGGPQLPMDIAAIVEAGHKAKEPKDFSNLSELTAASALTNLMNRDEQHDIKKFEAVEDLELNKQAWGDQVSKKPTPTTPMPAGETETLSKAESSNFRASLNSKLFKSSKSFSKRNPRKSLSRTNTENSLRVSQSNLSDGFPTQQDSLPDLETILTLKAKEQQQNLTNVVGSNILDNKAEPTALKTQVDEGWLLRNTGEEKSVTPTIATGSVTLAAKPKSFGLTGIDLSKLKPREVKPVKTSNDFASDNDSTALNQDEPPALQTVAITKPQRRVEKSDSDSVVSGSDNEDKIEKFHHRVKRRRLLAPLDEKLEYSDTKTTEETQTADVSMNEVNVNNMDEAPTETLDDFSADDTEKDADFVPEKPAAKSKRKTAVPKRSKQAKEQKKEPKPKKEVKPKSDETATKRKVKQAKPTKTLKSKEEDVEVIEQPPSTDELKSKLALDGGSLMLVPRVTLKELKVADQVVNRYIHTHAAVPTENQNKPNVRVDEKRLAAKRLLEKKIATGRLNENFVRINIEKKKYSRGKKTINFSKYKKKLWRDKKRVAALTGPDMDMGGCDGGVFKCFTCGQVGHFASNCKIKGDTLLPLTAQLEEDPSPFLTLEEAAKMAEQNAIAVHSKNISKLPQANNAALLKVDSGAVEEPEASAQSERAQESGDDDADEHDEDENDDNVESPTKESFMNSWHNDDSDDALVNFDIDAAISKEANEHANLTTMPQQFVGHQIPAEFLKKAGLDGENMSQFSTGNNKVGAIYDLNEDGTVKDVTPEVLEALHMFGHSSFRKGQDRAIMRILSGQSTLVTLSTGSGKSLCYQLPAYLYSRQKKSITLVVSPLVSLMEDQVTGVPHFLRAHCLHTNQTKPQRLKILQAIADGEVDILLVSPEAVVSGERSNGFGSILRQLPPIAFACIDEAHCMSQWSHNFRPSYLMICKVLKKNLGVQTVLGLTATATLPTRISVIEHLGIGDGERGIISDTPLPDNLILSVSKDANRDVALLQLLNSERFDQCQSIIIYCTRREECERIASFLRTSMQDRQPPSSSAIAVSNAKKKRKRVTWQAEPYHAGMVASRRRVIQNAFMKNELRIVVATIAFGMGINKPDIRAVIHYNMPRNFESYVQEIGRAGRDGKLAHCHLFLDARGGDQNELRRHVYANSIDRHVIRKLLQNIFVPCSCAKVNESSKTRATTAAPPPAKSGRICPGHEIGFSVNETVEALDIPEENIATLLCYMELDHRWNVNTLSTAYLKAKIISYGGPKYIKHAAKECPPLAMAIALEIKQNRFKEDSNILEFPVVDIASAIGWNSGVVKHQLKNLEWTNIRGFAERSPLTVQFTDLGFRLNAPGDFTGEEIDEALDTLYNRSVKQEKTQLIQLQYVFQGLSSVAYNNYIPCSKEDFPLARSEQLKAIIRDYFQNDYPKDLKLELEDDPVPDEQIIDDIHAIINMYPDNNFSGRTIARIFHGIQSPNYAAVMWGRCKFWRAHFKSDFNRIVRLANAVIVRRRT